MMETVARLAGRVADYTIGTLIVLVHVGLADRRVRAGIRPPRLEA